MTTDNTTHKCINCNKEETKVPLVSIRFSNNSTWICTQCLPTLIHDPNRLSDKFNNMDTDNPPEPKIS